MVRAQRAAVVLDDLGIHDRRGQVAVIEQGGVGGESLDAHELLGIQPALRGAELSVPLSGDLPDAAVVRHYPLRSVRMSNVFVQLPIRY
jgi:hypothetical protein